MSTTPDTYYRRDQRDGISPPDLSKDCTYAEHIVRARGKRTKYTSVSLDPDKIRDFGPALYKLDRPMLDSDAHIVIEHQALMDELRRVSREEDRSERLRAIQAQRYARARKEGLVEWRFSTSSVPRKELIRWATTNVQKYFAKVS